MSRSKNLFCAVALSFILFLVAGTGLSVDDVKEHLGTEDLITTDTDTLGEGLFRPGEIALPDEVERQMPAVVRVKPRMQFELVLHESAEQAAEARVEPGATDKRYLPDGGTVWPVVADPSTMTTLCTHHAARLQPGFYELCRVWTPGQCEEWPCTITTPEVEGSATGIVVGHLEDGDYVIATNYHVARESIERHERTDGRHSYDPADAPDVRVGVSSDGKHSRSAYHVVDDVQLLAHASEEEWQRDEDWALLSIPADAIDGDLPAIRLDTERPENGDTLWAAGFPTRTGRMLPLDSPYRNASDDFRVSTGLVEETNENSDILSTLDAVSGSSGSPVFNSEGELIGLLHDTTHREGEFDLRIAEYGGLARIVPAEHLVQALEELPLQRP